jgi:WD40 repeat protein
VFSVKFHPSEAGNVLVSGGWDNTVQIWDVRVGYSVRSIYGPHICGDSLDVAGDEILTGSWRPEDQLELWDFLSGRKIKTIPWARRVFSSQPCMLYAAQFSKEGQGRYIVAGGSGSNETKLFDHNDSDRALGTLTGLSRAVFTVDFAQDSRKLAVAGGDASIRILNITDE